METLYIPVQIKTRYELFPGYGFAELGITAAASLIAVPTAIVINLATDGVMFPVLMVLFVVAANVMVSTKDSLNLSMIDHIRNLMRFTNGQRIYPYRYYEN